MLSPLTLAVAVLLGLTYPAIVLAYFAERKVRQSEIERLTQRVSFTTLFRGYGSNQTLDLFHQFHDWRTYVPPVALNFLTVMGASLWLLTPALVAPDLSAIPATLVTDAPLVCGLLGGFLWGHYDLIRRLGMTDLTPMALYMIWLRLLVSGILGQIAGQVIPNAVGILVAFGLGTFPLGTLQGFIRNQTRKRLAVPEIGDETPALSKLQGMTTNIADRLDEENISSVQHLALVNPIRLLMRTNLEWTLILDLIDQAILACYVGNCFVPLRTKTGIRCALELSEIDEYFAEDASAADQATGTQLVTAIATTLKWQPVLVRNLIATLYADPQLDFIYRLWLEAFPGPEGLGAKPVPNLPDDEKTGVALRTMDDAWQDQETLDEPKVLEHA